MPGENQREPAGNEAEEDKKDVTPAEPEEGKKGEGEDSNADKEKEKTDDEENVTISKKEFNKLQVVKRKSEKKRRSSRSAAASPSSAPFSFEKPPEPDADETAAESERELNRFNNGVLRKVFKNKDYQKVLEQDKTLARVLENNPLSLIEGQPVDADDAIDQVVEFLDERVDELKTQKPEKKKEEKKEDEGGQPKPPEKIEVKDSKQNPEDRKTLGDVSKGIMGKVMVGGKSV